MANDHYTRGYNPQPTQRVGSTDLKNEFQAVQGGFDSIQANTRRTLRQVGGAEIAPMPNAISRALKLLSFDAAGNPVMVSGGGRYRGDWLTATEYIVSDYFRDPATKNIYSTLIGHTSSVLATDISSGKVQLAINVADVEAAKVAAQASAAEATTQAGIATAQAGAATTQASTATTQAGIATAGASTATTQAGTATTQAGIATTQAGIATTQAGIATTKAAEAAASAASISSGPVTSVNTKTGVVTLVPADIGLETASQGEMETGTETALRAMSPLRVAQAIATLGKGKITRSARTSNAALTAADTGKLIDITSGTFTQTFDAAATLGNGWFCYLRNSGTGDITLDPNGSETIDGLTSYVMYPGECRLVQCDGAALVSIVLNTFLKTFTASGTFTKPPGYSLFGALLWSGGSSGQRTGNSIGAVGGSGGGCFQFSLSSSLFGATETVSIGAGGAAVTAAASGNPGGATSIGSLASVFGPPSATQGGAISNNGVSAAITATGTGFEGGTGNSVSAVYGGASPSTSTNASGGSALYGGAAGGSIDSSGVIFSPGTSKYGGSGGAAGNAVNGSNGLAPGGGGGATRTGTSSGAGARGEVRIWGVI